MKNCPRCNNQINDFQNICNFCGYQVFQQNQASNNQAPPDYIGLETSKPNINQFTNSGYILPLIWNRKKQIFIFALQICIIILIIVNLSGIYIGKATVKSTGYEEYEIHSNKIIRKWGISENTITEEEELKPGMDFYNEPVLDGVVKQEIINPVGAARSCLYIALVLIIISVIITFLMETYTKKKTIILLILNIVNIVMIFFTIILFHHAISRKYPLMSIGGGIFENNHQFGWGFYLIFVNFFIEIIFIIILIGIIFYYKKNPIQTNNNITTNQTIHDIPTTTIQQPNFENLSIDYSKMSFNQLLQQCHTVCDKKHKTSWWPSDKVYLLKLLSDYSMIYNLEKSGRKANMIRYDKKKLQKLLYKHDELKTNIINELAMIDNKSLTANNDNQIDTQTDKQILQSQNQLPDYQPIELHNQDTTFPSNKINNFPIQKYCQNCRNQLQNDWISCPICGQNQQNMQIQRQECLHCGNLLLNNWINCPYCGQSRKFEENTQRSCTNCGNELDTNWVSCPYCSN